MLGVNKLTLDMILIYKLLFTKEKIHIFKLLNSDSFLYFNTELFFLMRSIYPKNGHNLPALLNLQLTTAHIVYLQVE